MICISKKEMINPRIGEMNNANNILNKPAILTTSSPVDKIAAPSNPPSSAWEEEDGIPVLLLDLKILLQNE